jgi:hypothetical protein
VTEKEHEERQYKITKENNPITKEMYRNIGKTIRNKGWNIKECFITTITGITGDGKNYLCSYTDYVGNMVKIKEFDKYFEFVDEKDFV